MKDIAQHYLKKIVTSDKYLSSSPVRDESLLYPPFLDLVNESIGVFSETHQGDPFPFKTETYRSNTLQLKYFNQKASKIKANGMHHYGIACDIAFKVNGEVTWNGDYKLLRECFKAQGLFLLGTWDMGHVQFIPATSTAQNRLRNEVSNAVKDFQKKYNLKVDGVVGKNTISKAKQVFL